MEAVQLVLSQLKKPHRELKKVYPYQKQLVNFMNWWSYVILMVGFSWDGVCDSDVCTLQLCTNSDANLEFFANLGDTLRKRVYIFYYFLFCYYVYTFGE